MVRPFYRNIRLLILTILMILAWGISSFQALPRQEDPELVSRTAIVKTAFPGASAERVEALVTEVLESELSELETIDILKSTSRVGFSTISVELVDRIEDTQPIWSKVRDEISDAAQRFPQGAGEPELEEAKVKAYTVITGLTWNLPNDPNYALLRRYGEDLAVAMRGVEGTEEVELFGAPNEEISVEVDAPELVAVGLSPQQLSQQIRLSDAKVSAGQYRSSEQNLAIEVESELETLEQIRRIPIQSSTGQFTRLSDIAQVSRGIRQPPTDLARISGKPAIALGVMMKSGLRIDHWATDIRQTLDEFRQRLPQGVELEVIFDQSGYVEERISSLLSNLVFGAILVVLVALVGMGWRPALVVGTALPLTVFGVFGWMTVVNIPIHQMSVTGLIIALGLLIDNAVVVVDEIQVELRHGKKPGRAVIDTVDYLKVPLFASTLTTVLTFLPIYLLPGGAGEFVGSIALSVILALISSLALSLTVIAALAGRMLANSEAKAAELEQQGQPLGWRQRVQQFLLKPGAWWNEGISSAQLGRLYRWVLGGVTAKPLLAIALTMLIPLLGFITGSTLKEQFFPLVDRDQFHIEAEFAAQTAIAQTEEKVLKARNIILEHPNVEDVHWFIGESAPKFYYNFIGSRQNQSQYAQAMVQLKTAKGAQALIHDLQAELDQAFPEGRMLVHQLQQGPPYEAPVEMRIYGPNLQELRRLGMEVRSLLTEIPHVTHVRDDLTEIQPKLGLQVDEEQAQQAGLNNTEIAQQLDAYLEGVVGGSILESTENLPVRVRLTNTDRANLEKIASLDLRPNQSRDREFRPTSALGEFRLESELAKISRRNEQRVNTVQAFITAGVLPSTVLAQFQQKLEERNFELPPGYHYEFGGEQAERSQAVGNLLLYVPLLALVMLTALVLSLGSFRQAGIVAFVAMGSVGMAQFSLWAFGSLQGFMAIVGTMGLVGIAINGSIIVLSAFNEDIGASRGERQAVVEVVVKATRHVLTTTITTMVGFIPLLISGGSFWRPLAIAIAGGVGGSPILALFFTPAAYLFLQHRFSPPKKQLSSTPSDPVHREKVGV
ncbi:efflux RND transporter permease subunit [Spirulina sp. CS-785/01]|uniref:efflux RND transporter permease subunit n=1 Tax=Spirulina sp. CS-785/01 TaxID=3021716 RepID=UPI00232D7E58|nr:efflux RND transporter permease subunit [Spirulina sp. CS-785/01]MDB9314141.1 efflux RND transporter permease subunit [Spirulina sp. CS-785/01]